jgi:hypothetical protein
LSLTAARLFVSLRGFWHHWPVKGDRVLPRILTGN